MGKAAPLTGSFVVLQGDDVSRALLQAFKQSDHEVADILSIWRRKSVFVSLDSGQGEALPMHLAGPGKMEVY